MTPFSVRRSRAATTEYLIYWGTYTAGGPRYGTGESKGIYVSRLDSKTGRLTAPELAAETVNPSYLAIHPNRRYVYSVNEHIDPAGKVMGEVSAFSIDRGTGKLRELNRVSSRGGMPCHICTDRTGKVVAVANWSTGSAALFAVRADGGLGESSGFYQHAGERSGAASEGQPPQVHCHAVVISRDNRFLIATDTGLNKVFIHRLDASRAAFTPHDPPFLGLKHPANPRHLVFHPNARWAYVANEAGPGCTMLHYDSKRGVFTEGAVTRTVPPEFTGRTAPAEAVLHPSGRFVFVSNRGHESIAVLRIDQTRGSLSLVEAFQPGGSGPRSFNIDPTGVWMFALMQRSNSIVPLRFDATTGKLARAGEPLTLPAPVCAKFV
ncbi:MAG: lactonase family protein [Bryobacteraceae bacterium]